MKLEFNSIEEVKDFVSKIEHIDVKENATNSGNRNSGNHNSGNRNSGNWNSGNWNSGDWNSGNCNSGNCNSGNWNSGSRNSGNCSSGNWNSGNRNSGNWNSGNCNSGNYNSGNYNSGDYNSGFFNTDEPTIRMFNKDTGLKRADITLPSWLHFDLTKWISVDEATKEEKEEHKEEMEICGGFLKTYEYKEAFKLAYDKTNDDEKIALFMLPNFDSDVFEEITGIDVRKDYKRLMIMVITRNCINERT